MTENTTATASGAADAISGASEAILGQLEDALVEWNGYVAASDAPSTLREHASPHIKMLRAELGRLRALAASAPVAPTQPTRIERKVYRGTPEHREYLSARFPRNGSSASNSFEWQGHRWAYQHTSFNDAGDYDLIYRNVTEAAPVAPAPQPALAEVMAALERGDFMVVDWGYNPDPLAEMDEIYADLSKSFGITPGPVMAKIVERHQARLQSWFGWHREAIRSALVEQAAAPLQQGEYLPLPLAKHHIGKYPDSNLSWRWVYLPDPNKDMDSEPVYTVAEVHAAISAARGAAQAAPAPVTHPVIAGALFDFLGYLTTLDTPVSFGSSQLSTPAVDHLQVWAKKRSLRLDEALVSSWSAQPAPVAEDAEDAARLDYLQKTGSTVFLVLGRHEGLHFQVGGLRCTENLSLRTAIDIARAQAAQPEGGAK